MADTDGSDIYPLTTLARSGMLALSNGDATMPHTHDSNQRSLAGDGATPMRRRWAFTMTGRELMAREVTPVPAYRDHPVLMQRLRRIMPGGLVEDIIMVNASGHDETTARAAATTFAEAWLALHGETEVCPWIPMAHPDRPEHL